MSPNIIITEMSPDLALHISSLYFTNPNSYLIVSIYAIYIQVLKLNAFIYLGGIREARAPQCTRGGQRTP